MKIRLLLVILGSTFLFSARAQVLKAGFDKSEYLETLKINQKAHIDLPKWEGDTTVPMPQQFVFRERSQVVAFDNLFDFWMHRSKPLALIAVRGSIPTGASFLANLYAAMIPASGELELKDGEVFTYQLSEDPRAAVHAGWCIAMAHIAAPVLEKIDSCYKAGIRDVILTGHSQGGGITFLLS